MNTNIFTRTIAFVITLYCRNYCVVLSWLLDLRKTFLKTSTSVSALLIGWVVTRPPPFEVAQSSAFLYGSFQSVVQVTEMAHVVCISSKWT